MAAAGNINLIFTESYLRYIARNDFFMKQAMYTEDMNSYVETFVFVDEITKAKIRRHLSDINDKITDEDLQNIRTSFLPPPVYTVPDEVFSRPDL